MKKAKVLFSLLLIITVCFTFIACSKTEDTNVSEKDKAQTEAPKAEAPKAEAPKAEAPKAEAPKAEAPKAEAPKAEAPKVEGKVVLEANFDDGQLPKALTTEIEGMKFTGNISVEDKALKLERPEDVKAAYDEAAVLAAGFTAEATRGELMFDAPLTGVVTFEYKMKTGEITGTKQFQIFGNGTDAEGNAAAVALGTTNFAKNNIQAGALAGAKVTNIDTTTENEWVDFRMVIDIPNNNVDYYIRGEKKHSQPLQNPATDILGIRFNIGAKQAGTLYVDNIRVSVN